MCRIAFLSVFLAVHGISPEGDLSSLGELFQRPDEETITWGLGLQDKRPQSGEEFRELLLESAKATQEEAPCRWCRSLNVGMDLEPDIMVFMSFSVPQSLWLELSKQMESLKGAFVVRGLPKDSFQDFAAKVVSLSEAGMKAPLMIDPTLFDAFSISEVPCFVVADENGFDKISGSVSVSWALDELHRRGEVSARKRD